MEGRTGEGDAGPAVNDVVHGGPAKGEAEVLDDLEEGHEKIKESEGTAGSLGKGEEDEEGEEVEAAEVEEDVRPVVSEKEPGGEPCELQGSTGGFQALPEQKD